MPFIDSKITVSLTPKKEEAIKTKLGEAIQILNKSETYLMVWFEDNYDLYMGGSKLDKGAYVSVSLFGQASPSAYSEMTKDICDNLSQALSIPGNQVYVPNHGVNARGWNGSKNFLFFYIHFSVIAAQNNNSIIGSYQRFINAATVNRSSAKDS